MSRSDDIKWLFAVRTLGRKRQLEGEEDAAIPALVSQPGLCP
jgi:hypothetical protein